MKRLNVPKPLIYAKIQNDTYYIDVLDNYDLIIYEILEQNVIKDNDIEVFVFDTEQQEYKYFCKAGSEREFNEQENYIILFNNKNIKLCLKEFVLKIVLPELNISGDVDQLSMNQNIIKYPCKNDRIFQNKLSEQLIDYKKIILEQVKQKEKTFSGVEGAITLDSRSKINKFIAGGIENVIQEKDPFTKYWYDRYTSRIYLGSQFCPFKIYDKLVIYEGIKKCFELGKNVTVNTSFVTEESISYFDEILKMLDELIHEYNHDIEVIINDYALLKLLESHKDMKGNLGVLLNRRQKDPRFSYRWASNKNHILYMENAVTAFEFNEFYQKFQYVEYEYNHIGNCFSQYQNVLHFPLYQTNTSRYCPMNAALINQDSNKQYQVKECKQYCESFYYQYADKTSLIGIGNSNFAICSDLKDMITGIKKGQIQRLVWDLI